MKNFSKKEIIELSLNPIAFKQAIIDSKGFILYLSEKYNINLDKKLLLDTISKYSIRFLSERMNVEKYDKSEIEIIVKYLEEEKNPLYKKTIKNYYDLKLLLKDIKEKNELPINIKDLYVLSFEDFINNQKEISLLLERNKLDFWRNDFQSSHPLLESLFKKLSKNDFFKIDIDTLTKYPSLFGMAKHLMGDSDIKKHFNKVVELYYNQSKIKRGGYKERLDSYIFYQFDRNEKDLFLKLLKNEYSSDYNTIKNYNGFSYFFEKDEYILNYNIAGIKYFNKKEIGKYINEIRTGILNAYFLKEYINNEKIYGLRIDQDSFESIFNKDFVKILINTEKGFKFQYFDRDNQEKTNKIKYITKLVYKLCAEDINIMKKVGMQNLLNNATNILEFNSLNFDEDFKKSTNKIIENFSLNIQSDCIFKNIQSEKLTCYKEFDIPNLMIKNMKGKESINYLFILIKIVNKNSPKDTWKNKVFLEEIERVSKILNKEDVKNLGSIMNFKFKSELLENNIKTQDYEQNFLNFNIEIIKKMEKNIFNEIFYMSEKFRNLILENNLDYIIIDNIKKDKNQNDLFFNLLKKITDKKSPYINFVKSFIKKNNKFVLDNYYSEIITHPMRKNLLKINTKELEIDSYSKVELLISKLLIEEENREKLEDINKNFKDKESSEIKEDIEQSIEIINNIKKEIKELTKNISFDFYYQKIESENIINAINLYYNGITGFSNLIYDKIENLTFEETKSLMHNKVFLNFIYNNKKSDSQIDNKRTLFLNKNFTNEQNIELIELMLINFNNNLLYKKTYEKKIELSSLLNLINKEKRFEISNDLVIKHDPENMFNSYDYIPNEEGYFSKHVREEFSVEQIMKAIEYLNIKNKKIICVSKPNLSHDNLLSNNYKNGNIKDYLRLLKNLENDPINYIAVIHSDIVQNFINKNDYKETFKYRDVAITDFYNKYINVDVVIEGMKQIFKTAKEYNENINYKNDNDNNTNEANLYNGIAVKNAINALRNFISFTYYSSSKDELISEFDIDKSKRILKEIIKDAPFLLFNTATIGKITNLMSEITNNFNEYIDKEFIDSLFLNSGKTEIISDMFSLDYEKRNEFWQSKIANKLIKKIIENLTSNEDIYSLQKLDFIIKQNIFNENLPYGKKLTDFSTQLTDFLCNKEYINMIEKSLLFVDLSTKTILIETNDKNKNKNKI